MATLQQLSDCCINPFAAQLLLESWLEYHEGEAVKFQLGQVVITIEPAKTEDKAAGEE